MRRAIVRCRGSKESPGNTAAGVSSLGLQGLHPGLSGHSAFSCLQTMRLPSSIHCELQPSPQVFAPAQAGHGALMWSRALPDYMLTLLP